MSELRVAAIGVGGIFGLAHAPAWKALDRARVVAVCDTDLERARSVAADLDCDAVFGNVDELLEAADVDVVDICTPHPSHAAIAIRSLEAGSHVICEKPLAMTVAETDAMMAAAARHDRQLFAAHTRRFDRRWIEVKRQLTSGRIGEPVAGRWTERSWAGFPADAWRWAPENGAILMDLGVHAADLFAWFFDAEADTAFATTRSVRPEAKRDGADDFALVQLGFPGGRQALMELSWSHPQAFAPYYAGLEIIGTEGKLSLSDQDAAPMIVVRDATDTPRYSTLLSTFPESFVDELDHFLGCIVEGSEPSIRCEDARHAVAAMNAAEVSSTSGRREAIDNAEARS